MANSVYLAKQPTLSDSLQVLLLQASDVGRGQVLFGDSASRAYEVVAPFLVGELFPEVYFEFPLAGKPFLDVTLLYGDLPPKTRVESPLAEGTENILDFFASARKQHKEVSFGFELDCGKKEVPSAAVHFQPRSQLELVQPFCDAAGCPERAALYLAQNERMPAGWKLSFFGMFRGRPNTPLRVCGYLGDEEQRACAKDYERIGRVLSKAGFVAYDEVMLRQISRVLALAPDSSDFQMDVWPDGRVGTTFAIDIRFDNLQAPKVTESFTNGAGASIVAQLMEWGIADERAHLLKDISLTRGVPTLGKDGEISAFGFTLVPGWLKVRWCDGVLQPSKMYLRASAGFVRKDQHADR